MFLGRKKDGEKGEGTKDYCDVIFQNRFFEKKK